MDDPLRDEIDERRWVEACWRADAIRDFLWRCPDGSTVLEATRLSEDLGLSLASTYRLIKIFREGGTVTSLVDRKRGRRKGHRMLDEARQKIIRATIVRFYLKQTRPPFATLVREVQTNCIAAGLEPPHLRTIKARLEDIDLQRRAK
jgi:putative transposase